MSKENISKNYTEQQKAKHGHKLSPVQKSVFMTGADRSKGIGYAITEELIRRGHSVAWPPNKFDIRKKNSDLSLRKHNSLVLCHGLTHLDWFEDCPEKAIDDMIDINFAGSVKLIQKFVRQTIDQNHRKSIVIIGSMAHKAVLNGSAVYCAAKAALAHLVRCLAWELEPKGFSVYIVHPSNTVGTPMTEETIEGLVRYRGISRPEAEAYWGAVCPKTEFLQREEIASLVASLVDDKFPYLSGSQIELSGGQR